MAYLHMAYPRGTPADGLTRPRGYRRWPNLYPCGYRLGHLLGFRWPNLYPGGSHGLPAGTVLVPAGTG